MNIYKVSRTDDWSYDDYSDIIVIAETPEIALRLTPDGKYQEDDESLWNNYSWPNHRKHLTVRLIGTATDGSVQGVIMGSFHAG